MLAVLINYSKENPMLVNCWIQVVILSASTIVVPRRWPRWQNLRQLISIDQYSSCLYETVTTTQLTHFFDWKQKVNCGYISWIFFTWEVTGTQVFYPCKTSKKNKYNAVLVKFEDWVKLFSFYFLVFYWGKTLGYLWSLKLKKKSRPEFLEFFSLQNPDTFSKKNFPVQFCVFSPTLKPDISSLKT
jgi:hypothetical protein